MQIPIRNDADEEYDIIVHRERDEWVIQESEETHGE